MEHVEAVRGTARAAMSQERVDEAMSRQSLWGHVELIQDRNGSRVQGCSRESL